MSSRSAGQTTSMTETDENLAHPEQVHRETPSAYRAGGAVRESPPGQQQQHRFRSIGERLEAEEAEGWDPALVQATAEAQFRLHRAAVAMGRRRNDEDGDEGEGEGTSSMAMRTSGDQVPPPPPSTATTTTTITTTLGSGVEHPMRYARLYRHAVARQESENKRDGGGGGGGPRNRGH
ncbi:hypothetical protein PT974_09350 [Cladobotryum mycophilum]|uniref:Uncharacterized protein n=1 Tax=Cladobotryum mycophilum TaxID=491253 RepID=A0ABR0SFW7_9HYPO